MIGDTLSAPEKLIIVTLHQGIVATVREPAQPFLVATVLRALPVADRGAVLAEILGELVAENQLAAVGVMKTALTPT